MRKFKLGTKFYTINNRVITEGTIVGTELGENGEELYVINISLKLNIDKDLVSGIYSGDSSNISRKVFSYDTLIRYTREDKNDQALIKLMLDINGLSISNNSLWVKNSISVSQGILYARDIINNLITNIDDYSNNEIIDLLKEIDASFFRMEL